MALAGGSHPAARARIAHRGGWEKGRVGKAVSWWRNARKRKSWIGVSAHRHQALRAAQRPRTWAKGARSTIFLVTMQDSRAIGRLPPNVAGKIRGSVVAPSFASAVVELVLNALDAAATKIHVQVDIENMRFQASILLMLLLPRAAHAMEVWPRVPPEGEEIFASCIPAVVWAMVGVCSGS